MLPPRTAPIRVAASEPASDISQSAAIIFMHGFGDDATGNSNIAHQFQGAKKLPYAQWIFPNAMENMDAMAQAWFVPTSLSPFPKPRPELEDDEDEDGIQHSIKYINSLIDELQTQGVPLDRIVVAGFSQGSAMALVMNLISKYAGKLGGVAGISGFLPLADRISEIRKESDLPAEVGDRPFFITRGLKDMLVPKRYFRLCQEKLTELGVKKENLDVHEYEDLSHTMSAAVLMDMCNWLEKVLPPIS